MPTRISTSPHTSWPCPANTWRTAWPTTGSRVSLVEPRVAEPPPRLRGAAGRAGALVAAFDRPDDPFVDRLDPRAFCFVATCAHRPGWEGPRLGGPVGVAGGCQLV